jgi:SAM-dependent methyltransferase
MASLNLHQSKSGDNPEEVGSRNEVLERERIHYDRDSPYWLDFLELDDSAFDRWLIRGVLRTWDRHAVFIDPGMICDKVVLDAGCGNPRMLFFFLELGAREAIGCDLSDRFLRRGLERPATYVHNRSFKTEPARIRFLLGDFCGSTTEGMHVDVISCFQSLHHFDLDRFVKTSHRLLRPGGRVIISDPVGNHPLRGVSNTVGRLSGLLSPDENSFSPEVARRRFVENGFKIVKFAALNPTLEIYFHLTGLLSFLPPRLVFYLKAPMVFLRPIENLLEATVVRLFPRFGWRYFFIFEKQ